MDLWHCPDYRETEFKCERCGDSLYQIWPSTLLICTQMLCTAKEPLFLVEVSDD